jgi:hypothetical protein
MATATRLASSRDIGCSFERFFICPEGYGTREGLSPPSPSLSYRKNGAPEEIRTPSLLIRSHRHMVGWLVS